MNKNGTLDDYVMPAHSMYYGREYRHVMPHFHWMYLIVAECNWKLNLGDEAVYGALKPIWERSFTNIADADVYKNEAIDIDFIIDEYQRELGMEFPNFFLRV